MPSKSVPHRSVADLLLGLSSAEPSGSKVSPSPPTSVPQRGKTPRGRTIHWDQWVAGAILTIPCLGVVAAVFLAWQHGIGLLELGLLAGMYLVSILGVSVGVHRLLSHHAFQTSRIVRALLAICGSMGAQGPVLYWAALHRQHHSISDQPGDLHSPQQHGGGFWGAVRGLWHAHIGFLFEMHANLLGSPEVPQGRNQDGTDWRRYIPDLLKDPLLVRVDRLYFLWVFLGLLIPTVIGGVVTGTGYGALLGFLWGGLVRLCVLHNFTGVQNSFGHMFGDSPFPTRDHSTNIFWLALPTFGDAYHNHHHAFPYSATVALRWWQIDPSGWFIRLLALSGLAWNVKIPTPRMIAEAARRT